LKWHLVTASDKCFLTEQSKHPDIHNKHGILQ